MKNVFACLVHERQECVLDLVRNLSYLDPDSTILVYNGGPDPSLLARRFCVNGAQPLIHQSPRRLAWGALHEFALDCMRHALDELKFDALTIVDSDQLLLRPGYSEALAGALAERPAAGMLGNAPGPQPPHTQIAPAAVAWRERDLWQPFLSRFPDGEAKYPHWTFWPSTVFTAEACRALVDLVDGDDELTAVMQQSRIWATEEIVLPTLVALLGYEVAASPFSYDYVRYGVLYTPRQLGVGMEREDVFWAHPVPRSYAHPLRRTVRARHGEYAHVPKGGMMTAAPSPSERPLLLTMPILERMRRVEGWLSDAEGDLLVAGVSRAVTEFDDSHAVVEIGSYCGRSTVVLGSVVKALAPTARVYAIDPHEGEVGSLDHLLRTPPTLAKFNRTIAAAELEGVVETIQQRSYDTVWERPISFLLIDGLHDYPSVSRDLEHFEPWLAEGAFIAFHDYADYYPGVKTFVDEVLATGSYERVHCAASMMLVRRVAAGERPRAARLTVSEREPTRATQAVAAAAGPAAGAAASAPRVSCVMPTYNRPTLAAAAAARFLRQEDVDAELIVVDDGAESVTGVLPDDQRIRHVRLERRQSIGAKRNIGCEEARGDLLANWDDDDWYAPWRLAYEARSLEHSGADVVGLNALLYVEPSAMRAWRYAWPGNARPWVHDAVLLFTGDFWRRNPFPDTSMGIDCAFLWTPSRKRIVALSDERFYVGVIHGRNTSPKNTSAGVWHPHPLEDVEALLGEEAAFFRQALGAPAGIAV